MIVLTPEGRRHLLGATAAAGEIRSAEKDRPAQQAIQRLGQFARERGLEVHLRPLPQSSTTIIQFVDPRTSQVVREFPDEDLAQVLAAIRSRTGPTLDQQG